MSRILITGGAGFIGSNLASRLLRAGHQVVIFDNFCRSGSASNVQWLRSQDHAARLQVIEADITDFPALLVACEGIEIFYHLAGQVAVTTSVVNPRVDFEGNALGTFNALEAARLCGSDPIFIYASTNKVYGGMENLRIVESPTRYAYVDLPSGVSETMLLDFHSPYGCSKGTGDQYTRDYHRIYGLRTVVMRQSCIYGYRQFGIEDQGWVAWFIIAALKNRRLTIYGDGKQVRDVLFIDDLLDAYELAVQRIGISAGQVYNIGGGRENTLAIWSEFSPLLESLLGREIPVIYNDWRPGDQRIYVSDISKAQAQLGWLPKISVKEGIGRLYNWIRENQHLFAHL
ncbi:MAG: GDP-mannose 4,6-dehydratase [Anaerolineae bacterium]|nr:GDP-mannose 4,6-dehydratase [Anaerolineae bacterium]